MSESARPDEPAFVDPSFLPPPPPRSPGFFLTPLGVEHNEADLEAWSSSVEHIHATAGFEGHPWPDEPMPLYRTVTAWVESAWPFASYDDAPRVANA